MPLIDYLAKDYASFRRLMLDRLVGAHARLGRTQPGRCGRGAGRSAGLCGDHLSYHQDAVATEAYLGTARRRVSVRRHARLVDYRDARRLQRPRPGCTSAGRSQRPRDGLRLPHVDPTGAHPLSDPLRRRQRGGGRDLSASWRSGGRRSSRRCTTAVSTATTTRLLSTPGATRSAVCRQGATRATLQDRRGQTAAAAARRCADLRGAPRPADGQPADADPTHRHVVRLTSVNPSAALVLQDGRKSTARPVPPWLTR